MTDEHESDKLNEPQRGAEPVGKLTESERGNGNFQDENGDWWRRMGSDEKWSRISRDW